MKSCKNKSYVSSTYLKCLEKINKNVLVNSFLSNALKSVTRNEEGG